MERFASGWKQNYYGKGDVIVYRLNRDGDVPRALSGVRRQRQDADLRRRLLAHLHDRRQHRPGRHRFDEEFHPARDPELRGLRSGILLPLSGARSSWRPIRTPKASRSPRRRFPIRAWPAGSVAFAPPAPSAPLPAWNCDVSGGPGIVEARSGIHGFRLLRLGGSAFHGFVRDQYTTLPDIHNRPLHMWLDLEWTYIEPAAGVQRGRSHGASARAWFTRSFTASNPAASSRSSIRLGTKMLEEIPDDRRGSSGSQQPNLGYRRRKQGDDARRLHRRASAVRMPRTDAAEIAWRDISTHVLDTRAASPPPA